MNVTERLLRLWWAGWKVSLNPHSMGRFEWLEEHYPSKNGHWSIVYHDGEQAMCAGVELTIIGHPSIRPTDKSWRLTGVHALVEDCLDVIEGWTDAAGLPVVDRPKTEGESS